MEKRVLVAIFLSFLVLYVYQALFVKPVPKPQGTTAATSTVREYHAPGDGCRSTAARHPAAGGGPERDLVRNTAPVPTR